MVMSRDQNAGRSHIRKIDNTSFERVELLYLGTTLTYQYSIQKEIQGRMKSGTACRHSVQELLSHSLLSKILKIKVNRTKFCLLVCLGFKFGRSLRGRNIDRGCLRIGC